MSQTASPPVNGQAANGHADTLSTNGHDTAVEDAAKDNEQELEQELSPELLHEALNDRGYICDLAFAEDVYVALNTRPMRGAFLFGPPGAGKTELPKQLASLLFNDRMVFYQCTEGTREEHLLFRYLPDEDATSGIRTHEGPMIEAARKSHEGPVILLIDEWDKTRPTADAMMYEFLQSGRLVYADIDITANTENLAVFITMNDEREPALPLQRRMPWINFRPLAPSLVRKALQRTHGMHGHIEACVHLYVRCLFSDMEKPCTIQELRQLLDAITALGDRADWDRLVFRYVTKNMDNHQCLKDAEHMDVEKKLEDWGQKAKPLDSDLYTPIDTGDDDSERVQREMPTLSEVRFKHDFKTRPERDLSRAFGVMVRSDSIYDKITKSCDEPNDDPADLGWAEVRKEHLVLNEPLPLADITRLDELDLWGDKGEVMLVEETATFDDVRELQSNFVFTKFSKQEIIARCRDKTPIDIRWTPENGAEIIIPLESRSAVRRALSPWIGPGDGSIGSLTPHIHAMKGDLPEIVRRRDGIPEYTLYHTARYDKWGDHEWDTKADSHIPDHKEFLRYAEKHAEEITIRKEGEHSHRMYRFEHCAFSFYTPSEDYPNDVFRLVITGVPTEEEVRFIRQWVPKGRLYLKRVIDVPYGEDENVYDRLIKEKGFVSNDEIANTVVKVMKGNKSLAVYLGDRTIEVAAKLIGDKITRDNIKERIEHVNKMCEVIHE